MLLNININIIVNSLESPASTLILIFTKLLPTMPHFLWSLLLWRDDCYVGDCGAGGGGCGGVVDDDYVDFDVDVVGWKCFDDPPCSDFWPAFSWPHRHWL